MLQRLAGETPGDIVQWCRLGEAFDRRGEVLAAARHFAHAAGLEPATDDRWQWVYKAIALIRTQQLGAAETILLRLLERDPRDVEATYHLVRLLIDRNDLDAAVERLRAVVEPGPDDAASRRRGEFTYLVFQLTEKGVSAAVPLLELLVEHAPENIVATYRLGEALASRGKLTAAEACFERAARTTPSDVDPWQPLYRALALMRTGRLSEAEAALRGLVRLDEHLVEAAYHLCRLLIRGNRLSEAAAVLAAEVELSSRGPRARGRVEPLGHLAVELTHLGSREAVAVLESLVNMAPDDTVLRYGLATAIAAHAPSDARPHFELAAAAAGAGPDAESRRHQALALARLGRINEAEFVLRELLVRDPSDHAVLRELSQLYLDHGRPSESLALLTSLVSTLTMEERTSFGGAELGYQLHRLAHSHLAGALPLLRRLADLVPEDILVQFYLADAYKLARNSAEAARSLALAAEGVPAHTDLWGWHYKALALQRLGRHREALAVGRHAWSLDNPPIEVAAQLIESLTALQHFTEAVEMLDAVTDCPRQRDSALLPAALELAICRVAAADRVVQRLFERYASDASTLELFARVASNYSLAHEAIDCIARLRAISDSAVRRLDGELILPRVLSNDTDIAFWADRFSCGAERLISSGNPIERPLSCIAVPPYFQFFTYGINTRELYRQAARVWQVAHPDLTWTAPHCHSWRQRPLRARVRVGFYTQPTFPLAWGIARELDRNDFEVVHLYESSWEMTPDAPWHGAADSHVVIPETSIADAQRVIAEQELDILVHMPFSGLRYFLSHARLAPIQCVLCEPCYTDGIDNLDYYMSWASAEPFPLDEWYGCKVALMDRAPYWIERSYTRSVDLPRSDFPLPMDAHWYLCPSSPAKLHPRFDSILARILTRDPDGILVLLRGDAQMSRIGVERVRRAAGPAADRVYSLRTLSEDQAHALLRLADSVLDSWPMGGMSSSFAAIHAGVPTVTMPADIPFGRWMAAMYEAIGVTDLIASTPDQYVELALRLVSDPSWKAAIADRIRAGSPLFVESHAAVREVATFLREAVAAAHRGEAPRHWRAGRFAD